MGIDLQKLNQMYSEPSINGGWLIIGNSKENVIEWGAGAAEGSNGHPDNAWKIHISIDPNKMPEAVALIGEILNDSQSPKVTIKIAHPEQAHTGQPSKQVALKFYSEHLQDKVLIKNFLEKIDQILWENGIGQDPSPINSDPNSVKAKYDAPILHENTTQSRFNYRFENAIVMEDALYHECGGQNDITRVGQQVWVKQSYYEQLDNKYKHNPSGENDPFSALGLRNINQIIEAESNSNTVATAPWGSLENDFQAYISISTREVRVSFFDHMATSNYWSIIGKPERLQLHSDYLAQKDQGNRVQNSSTKILGLFSNSEWRSLDKDFKEYVSVSTRDVRHGLLDGIATSDYWNMMGEPERKNLMSEYSKHTAGNSSSFHY
ncbi:hypothetical protein [Legionella sainthelensi]|uniref:Uncharacterized protein n=1 Tax=Legionella sainthelensi TaxID=28087 RepID=A0A2H5FQ87_9GAMM|nr:hypothetical protein [Legionella sainthelensi]AUH73729.1 hypothetical protein CAB17_18020 [Legionella sainthelensi]